jgi:hypothetical protein
VTITEGTGRATDVVLVAAFADAEVAAAAERGSSDEVGSATALNEVIVILPALIRVDLPV